MLRSFAGSGQVGEAARAVPATVPLFQHIVMQRCPAPPQNPVKVPPTPPHHHQEPPHPPPHHHHHSQAHGCMHPPPTTTTTPTPPPTTITHGHGADIRIHPTPTPPPPCRPWTCCRWWASSGSSAWAWCRLGTSTSSATPRCCTSCAGWTRSDNEREARRAKAEPRLLLRSRALQPEALACQLVG